MGARPVALVACLVLPGAMPVDWVVDLARGMALRCREAGAAIVGGDLSAGEGLVVTVTVGRVLYLTFQNFGVVEKEGKLYKIKGVISGQKISYTTKNKSKGTLVDILERSVLEDHTPCEVADRKSVV